jgi:Ca-activated chloride channel family protein
MSALALLLGRAIPPSPLEPSQTRGALKVAVDLVLLDVSVADQKGRPIRNLDRDQFAVYEDKIEQPISYFSQEESPVTWGLVLDRSASMSGKIRHVYEAAIHILGEGLKDDEMFIMTFQNKVELVSTLTSNREQLQDSIIGLEAEGSTAMHDAVGAALEYIKQGRHRKKVLVVVTDGMDNHSRLRFKDLRDRVRETDVVVYVVGMYDILESFQARKGALNDHELEEIAEITGGYAYFPTDMEKCRQTMRSIAAEVAAHYTIGYYPTNQMHDGSWRKTKVTVTPRDKIAKPLARTRSGYYAAQQ